MGIAEKPQAWRCVKKGLRDIRVERSEGSKALVVRRGPWAVNEMMGIAEKAQWRWLLERDAFEVFRAGRGRGREVRLRGELNRATRSCCNGRGASCCVECDHRHGVLLLEMDTDQSRGWGLEWRRLLQQRRRTGQGQLAISIVEQWMVYGFLVVRRDG